MRIRLLITSPNQPPMFDTTVLNSSATSTAAAISTTARTAEVGVCPPTAPATVSVAWPIRKGTARAAAAVSTEQKMIAVYSGARARVKRTMRRRDATSHHLTEAARRGP